MIGSRIIMLWVQYTLIAQILTTYLAFGHMVNSKRYREDVSTTNRF